jgi:hypothetical protein
LPNVGTVMNPEGCRDSRRRIDARHRPPPHAISQKWVYDQHYGRAVAKRFHYNKPPTILDAPPTFKFAAVNLPDPETPRRRARRWRTSGRRGICAVMNAIAAAVGDRSVPSAPPVTADMILTALENGGKRTARTSDGTYLGRARG